MDPGSFIPRDQRLALAGGSALRGRVNGAVLVADLAGSTPFIEGLIRAVGEERGVDLLGGFLNTLFEACIQRVHALGGSVVGFGGDAIVCWFPSPHEPAALQCAYDLREIAQSEPWKPQVVGLPPTPGLKLAVAAGPAWRCVVGDPRVQRIDLLSGEPMDRAWALERQTRAGEILVDDRILALAPELPVHSWREDPTWGRCAVLGDLPHPLARPGFCPALPPAPEGVERWLNPMVEQRFSSLGTQFFDELRVPVIVFLSFRGLGLGEGDPQAILDAVVRHAQGCFHRREGILLEVEPGDKGNHLYGAFGALQAHRDDAVRAVGAARELLELGSILGPDAELRIGIARGPVYAGTYGMPHRRTYGVLGRDVHIAARLMELGAPGEILATTRVFQDIDRVYETSARGPVELRGIETPVPVLAVGSPRPVPAGLAVAGDLPLFGRQAELGTLRARLDELVATGRGGNVWIWGEPGIGKSHLVSRLELLASGRGIPVLTVIADAQERGSYHPWRAALVELLGLTGIDAAQLPTRALEALEARGVPSERAAHLQAVLAVDLHAEDTLAQLPADLRAVNTRGLVCELVHRHLSERGGRGLVVVEDLQWLDESSWALLRELAERCPEVLLVGTSRPVDGELLESCEGLVGGERGVTLELDRLGGKEIRELVRSRLDGDLLDPELESLVQERCEGNPFYASALVQDLLESGRIRREAGRVLLEHGTQDALPVPRQAQDYVVSRVDRLTADQKVILKLASVVGRAFELEILEDVLAKHLDAKVLRHNLRLLQVHGLIEASGIHARPTFLFEHAITRDAVYATLLESQKAGLHGAVAAWLEERVGPGAGSHLALLAHHWRGAGDTGRALDCLLGAGDHALANSANEDAASFYRRALELGADPAAVSERGRGELGLGAALANLGKYQEASHSLSRGLVHIGMPMPRSELGFAVGTLWHLALQGVHRLLPGIFVGRSRRRAEPLLVAARAFEKVAEAYFLSDQQLPAYYAGFAWLNVAEAAGPSVELARAYSSLCAALGVVPLGPLGVAPMRAVARLYLRWSHRALPRDADPATRSLILVLTSFFHACAGDWEEAELAGAEAVTLSASMGDSRRLSDALSMLVPIDAMQGHGERGVERAERHVAACRGGGLERNLCEALYCRAAFFPQRGMDATMADLEELEGIAARDAGLDSGFVEVSRLSLRARAELAAEKRGAARDTVRRLVQAASDYTPNLHSTLSAFAAAGEVLLELADGGPDSPSASELRSAVDLMATYARIFPIGRPRLLVLRARLASWEGDTAKALRLASTARAQAESLAMPGEAAMARSLERSLEETSP